MRVREGLCRGVREGEDHQLYGQKITIEDGEESRGADPFSFFHYQVEEQVHFKRCKGSEGDASQAQQDEIRRLVLATEESVQQRETKIQKEQHPRRQLN